MFIITKIEYFKSCIDFNSLTIILNTKKVMTNAYNMYNKSGFEKYCISDFKVHILDIDSNKTEIMNLVKFCDEFYASYCKDSSILEQTAGIYVSNFSNFSITIITSSRNDIESLLKRKLLGYSINFGNLAIQDDNAFQFTKNGVLSVSNGIKGVFLSSTYSIKSLILPDSVSSVYTYNMFDLCIIYTRTLDVFVNLPVIKDKLVTIYCREECDVSLDWLRSGFCYESYSIKVITPSKVFSYNNIDNLVISER